MKTVKMKLSELHPVEKNVRIHTSKQTNEFKRSIEMFGQIRPIVVDESYNILCGNGLYKALLDMNKTEADVLVVYALTENQKKKLMIADNKIYSLGIDNLENLNLFFEELKDDLDIPGYDEDILKSMMEEAEEVTERIADYGIVPETVISTIKENAQKNEKIAMVAGQEEKEPSIVIRPTEEKTPPATDPEKDENNAGYILCPHCGGKIWL